METTTKNGRGKTLKLILSLALPLALVALLLLALTRFRGEIESGVADLTTLLPIGYAFAAGMVASVNPCGVLMLPAYISYQFSAEGGSRRRSPAVRVLTAILLSLIITIAFVLVFAATGGIISAGGQWLVSAFPYAGALIGVAMAGLGLWLLLSNRHLAIDAAASVYVSPSRSLGNAFAFGLAYAVASLGCTLPIFLVVVGGTLAGSGFAQAIGQFLGYALGMGIVVVAVMVAASLFEELVTNFLVRISPYVERTGALFLLGAGAYLVYYWLFESAFFF